jgi:hypothetical protein
MRTVTVSGQRFRLDEHEIEQAVADSLPEPIRDHFVVVDGRRWPPKQVLALATGLDRADFTTHQARRILTRLAFPAGRLSRTSARRAAPTVSSEAAESARGRPATAGELAGKTLSGAPALAEALRPFVGQWVAVRGPEVLVAAPAPRQVVAWLTEHGQQAQSVFRVPDSEQAVGGAAPL